MAGRQTKKTGDSAPTISLCMIVKDEAAHLPTCLKSVQGVVDEIIVVDTGSTDETKKIALEHGAKVFDFKWCDDFSAARNFSIAQATTEWVFILDADDSLSDWTRGQLRSIVAANSSALGLSVKILQDKSGYAFNSVRLFKTGLNIRYVRPVHEQVFFGDAAEEISLTDIPMVDLVIRHHQYHEDASDLKRTDRNIRLLKQAIADDPGDRELYFYLGQEMMVRGDNHTAMEYLLKAIDMYSEMPAELLVELRSRSMFPYAVRDLMKVCILEDELDDAISLFEWAKTIIPDYADIYYIAATAKQGTKAFSEAAELFAEAMAAAERGPDFAIEPKMFSNCFRGMGSSYYYAGDMTKARESYIEALAEDPADVASAKGLTYVMKEQYTKNEMLPKIGEFADLKNKDILDAVVSVLNE